jgi:hypothetical protein
LYQTPETLPQATVASSALASLPPCSGRLLGAVERGVLRLQLGGRRAGGGWLLLADGEALAEAEALGLADEVASAFRASLAARP